MYMNEEYESDIWYFLGIDISEIQGITELDPFLCHSPRSTNLNVFILIFCTKWLWPTWLLFILLCGKQTHYLINSIPLPGYSEVSSSQDESITTSWVWLTASVLAYISYYTITLKWCLYEVAFPLNCTIVESMDCDIKSCFHFEICSFWRNELNPWFLLTGPGYSTLMQNCNFLLLICGLYGKLLLCLKMMLNKMKLIN